MKKFIVIVLSLIAFCSCSGTKKAINVSSCNGMRPKAPVYITDYRKTDVYRKHIRLMDFQERSARKSSNSYAGIYRY